ncbi:MAG: hypothetical protein KAX40_09375, partial [Herpetosiphon sp.]|nr:hypothetical protein [Herpetosiphon sp.]
GKYGLMVFANATVISDTAGVLTGQVFEGEQGNMTGRPALPNISIPVEDQNGNNSVRGIVLSDANQRVLSDVNLAVTKLITDQNYLPNQETPYDFDERWFPDQPFGYSSFVNKTPQGEFKNDQLLITPAQFRGTNVNGDLRLFDRMVFEVRYLDDWADPTIVRDTVDPVVIDTSRNGDQIDIVIQERTIDGPGANVSGEVFVLLDDGTWESVELSIQPGADLDLWQGTATLPANTAEPLQLLILLEDASGNVGTETFEGTLTLGSQIYLPLIQR